MSFQGQYKKKTSEVETTTDRAPATNPPSDKAPGVESSTDKAPEPAVVPRKTKKRKENPMIAVEEVRDKISRVSVEVPSAELATRGEPNVEAEVLSLPASDVPELPPLSSLSDLELKTPLAQV